MSSSYTPLGDPALVHQIFGICRIGLFVNDAVENGEDRHSNVNDTMRVCLYLIRVEDGCKQLPVLLPSDPPRPPGYAKKLSQVS